MLLTAKMSCPQCQRRLQFPLTSLGRTVLCPTCRAVFPLSLKCPTCSGEIRPPAGNTGSAVTCERCRRQLMLPTAAPATPEPRRSEDASDLLGEVERWKAQSTDLRRRLKAEQDDRLRLVHLAEVMKRALEDSRGQMERLSQAETSARAEVSGLKAEHQRLLEQVRELRRQHERDRNAHQQASELRNLVRNLEGRLAALQTDHDHWRREYQLLEGDAQRFAQVSTELDTFRSERERLLAQLADADDRLQRQQTAWEQQRALEIESLERERSSLRDELTRLTGELEAVQAQLATERTTWEQVRQADSAARDAERQSLLDQLERLRGDQVEQERLVANLRDQLEAAHAQSGVEQSQWAGERQRLLDQLERLRADQTERDARIEALSSQLQSAEDRVGADRAAWEQDRQSEALAWAGERQRLQTEIDQLRATLSTLEQELARHKDEVGSVQSLLSTERTTWDQARQADSAARDAERQSLLDQLERLRGDQVEQERLVANLRDQLEAAHAQSGVEQSQWSDERQSLLAEIGRLRDELENLQAELGRHQRELADARAQLEAQPIVSSRAVADLQAKVAELHTLKVERSQLEQELTRLRAAEKLHQEQVDRLLGQLDASQAVLDSERAETARKRQEDTDYWERERDAFGKKVSSLVAMLGSLENELQGYRLQASGGTQPAAQDNAESVAHQAERQALADEIERLRAAQAERDGQVALLQQELAELQAQLEAHGAEAEQLIQDSRRTWDQERRRLENERSTLREELDRQRTARTDQENLLLHLQRELAETQARLQQELADSQTRLLEEPALGQANHPPANAAEQAERNALQAEIERLRSELTTVEALHADEIQHQQNWWLTEQGLWEAERAGLHGELEHLRYRVADLTNRLSQWQAQRSQTTNDATPLDRTRETNALKAIEPDSGSCFEEDHLSASALNISRNLPAKLDPDQEEEEVEAVAHLTGGDGAPIARLLEDLTRSRDDLARQAEEEREHRRRSEQEIRQLSEELARLREEAATLRDQNQETRDELERLTAERNRLDHKQRHWQTLVADTQREIDTLRDQITRDRAEAEAKAPLPDYWEVVAERDRLQAREADLERLANDARSQLAGVQAQTEEAERRIEDLQSQLIQTQQQLGTLQTQRDQLQRQLSDLQTASSSRRDVVTSAPSAPANPGVPLAPLSGIRVTMNEEISWSRATLLDPDVLHELAVDALGEEPTMIEGPPPKTSPSDTSPAVRDALLRGWNSQQANRLQDAVGWYQRALRDAPDDPEALYLLGTVYLRLNDPAIAGEYLQQATIGSPTRADFRCNLGVALAMQGRLEEAIQAFRETLKINPDYAEARQNLNQALAELHSHIVGGRR